MNGKRGFVFSVSTILIVIVLVWFASFYAGKVDRQELTLFEGYAIEKAGFVADDITYDVNALLGTAQDVDRGPNFLRIRLGDKIPADINKLQLVDLNNFVDGNYATMQRASIGLGLGNLLDGKTEMVFSNGLQYDYAYNSDQNFVLFRNSDGGSTGVLTYDLNLHFLAGRVDTATPWACDSGNDVNVNLYYRDDFGNSSSTTGCEQNPAGSYTYTFTFVDQAGSVTVEFGSVDGNQNAVQVRNAVVNPNISVKTSVQAVLPSPSDEIEWFYDADLNYVHEDVNLNRKIVLGRA